MGVNGTESGDVVPVVPCPCDCRDAVRVVVVDDAGGSSSVGDVLELLDKKDAVNAMIVARNTTPDAIRAKAMILPVFFSLCMAELQMEPVRRCDRIGGRGVFTEEEVLLVGEMQLVC